MRRRRFPGGKPGRTLHLFQLRIDPWKRGRRLRSHPIRMMLIREGIMTGRDTIEWIRRHDPAVGSDRESWFLGKGISAVAEGGGTGALLSRSRDADRDPSKWRIVPEERTRTDRESLVRPAPARTLAGREELHLELG